MALTCSTDDQEALLTGVVFGTLSPAYSLVYFRVLQLKFQKRQNSKGARFEHSKSKKMC